MNKNQLITLLSQNNGINDIVKLTFQTLDGRYSIVDILDICFDKNPKTAFRAAWLLENIERMSAEDFVIICPNFIKRYPEQRNFSAQRHFTLIMMRITEMDRMQFYELKSHDFDAILEATFKWLINPKTPVAVQCNAIDILYHLAKYHDWVMDELVVILEKNLITDSAALISRSKRILKQMKSK